jgi:hypothetical protein
MALTRRAHLYRVLRDEKGDLYRYARIRIYEEDGKTLYQGKIYRDQVSEKIYSNPFALSPALVDLYLKDQHRVVLGYQLDIGSPELKSDVIDVRPDADMAVDTAIQELWVDGSPSDGALLCGIDATTAYWKPLRVDHEHEGIAPGSTRLGDTPVGLRQSGAYDESTVLGAGSGGWGAASSLRRAVMVGYRSDSYGRQTVAVGREAFAEEGDSSPWLDGAIAVGFRATASSEGIALGGSSWAYGVPGATATGVDAIAIGTGSRATDTEGISLGRGAIPGQGGVALGRSTGSLSHGPPNSIGIGSGAQYGLPSTSDPAHTAVLIGPADPLRPFRTIYANPASSQSESPWEEYLPTMQFTGRTVQVQRHLNWHAVIAALQVLGDATVGGLDGLLGFFGANPRVQGPVGEDEPCSGITALDNLIYALRDLNLIMARTEPVMLYRSEDLRYQYGSGEKIVNWPEHFGRDIALPVTTDGPTIHTKDWGGDWDWNFHPTIIFNNSIYRRATRPVNEMRGQNILPRTQHFIAFGEHYMQTLGQREGIVNLTTPWYVDPSEGQVLMGEGYDTTRWDLANSINRYERDALNQTSNRETGWLPDCHAWQVDRAGTWPYGRPIIGGPRENTQGFDRWSGAITELVGMDNTWPVASVQSMTKGLMFKYHIGQQNSWMWDPAHEFLIKQHDPLNGTMVFWDCDYPDYFIGKCYGRATRVPKPIAFIPFISIYVTTNLFSFRGSLSGLFGNLSVSIASQYEVQVSVMTRDVDGDGDLDVAVNFDVERETHVGVFALNNNLTWSMGRTNINYGYKVCRIRHRVTKATVCISGDPPYRYLDTEVRVYSTKSDGSLLLEGTSPLWGDGTFNVRVHNKGKKIARVVEVSTGNTLGTTEWQEKALPRTQLYADDDSEQTFAKRDEAQTRPTAHAVLGLLELPNPNWWRPRAVLRSLKNAANTDGSLNTAYSAVLPERFTGTKDLNGTIWVGLAILRYQQIVGDEEMLPWARQLADWVETQTLATTVDKALAWFLFRDLGRALDVEDYLTTAESIRTDLLTNCWVADPGRFRESPSKDAESLLATVYGGLFLLAIGDRAKSKACIRHLKRFRVKNKTVAAPHYTGPTGRIGYKPQADAGSSPWVNPPDIIDQYGSWAAVMFKMRYGEPFGEDVHSLFDWRLTKITSDPTGDLYAAQFLAYNANYTTAPYNLRARPHLSPVSLGRILSHGGKDLMPRDPMTFPCTSVPICTPRIDRPNNSCRIYYSFYLAISIHISINIFEVVPECSYDSGRTWVILSHLSVQMTLAQMRDVEMGPNGYSGSWAMGLPDTPGTLIRARVRGRSTYFSAWQVSASITIPAKA